MEWLAVGGGFSSLVLPLLSFLSLFSANVDALHSVMAELSFFFLSLSAFSFSSIFLDRERKGMAEIVFIISGLMAIATGIYLFPLAIISATALGLFIFSFLRHRDDYLFAVSISLLISSPVIYAASLRSSAKWIAYASAFFMLSLSAVLRWQIMKSFSSSETLNAATKHGILKVKREALLLSIAFSVLAAISAIRSIHLAPLIAVSIAFSMISGITRHTASFYMTLASIILFASVMVVL